MAVDPRALTGFAASAAAYDRARPSYPEAAVAHRLAPEDFMTLVALWSWIVNLPADERGSVLERVRELIGARPEVALRYVIDTYAMRKR